MLENLLDSIAQAALDLTGATCVVVSLVFLVRKHPWYWHFSNLSLLPYFLLFFGTQQFMLAGLQVSYLIFGMHGWYLWRLETGRDHHSRKFNETFWYNFGWILALLIFAFTATVSDFSSGWTVLQFVVTSLSLVANWATTRRWIWSWYVWIVVNVLQSVLFLHLELWALLALQGVLASMSVYGLLAWRRQSAVAGV